MNVFMGIIALGALPFAIIAVLMIAVLCIATFNWIRGKK